MLQAELCPPQIPVLNSCPPESQSVLLFGDGVIPEVITLEGDN